jgi:hypothetical protein
MNKKELIQELLQKDGVYEIHYRVEITPKINLTKTGETITGIPIRERTVSKTEMRNMTSESSWMYFGEIAVSNDRTKKDRFSKWHIVEEDEA